MKDNAQTPEDQAAQPFGDSRQVLRYDTTHLRILATTDIHMQLLGHDYVQDRNVGHNGLAGLATLIKEARAEAQLASMRCLLVDNGDMLQGSALGDAVARAPVTAGHPVAASLNALKYDAVGVGNHDLDHGLPYLESVAALTNAPFVSSNMTRIAGSALVGSALVSCDAADHVDAESTKLTVGFVSVMPEQTEVWNKPMLEGQARILPARAALTAEVTRLRARGTDIIVLLAHMGVEDGVNPDDVRDLANVPGIDAMIAGHTHRRLPGQDHAGFEHVDTSRGTLGVCPAAMPGFNASDLAVLDLRLDRRENGTWRVADHHTHLRRNTVSVLSDPIVSALCLPAHNRVRAALATPVGHTRHTLHNFFSLAMPTPTCALAACAKYRVVAEGLDGTPDARLPLIATASAHTAGGRGGPDHFIHIPPGKVYRRALAGLSPYANEVCGLRVNGAEVLAWLEHTVGIYARLTPGQPDQPLLRADRPTFHFDTIYGLRYRVDPTRPTGERITQLTFGGSPVESDQPFILATTNFRAAGGGGGVAFDASRIAYQSSASYPDTLQKSLGEDAPIYAPGARPWSFDCPDQITATLQTAPMAVSYLDTIAHLSPDARHIDAQGFLPIRLQL